MKISLLRPLVLFAIVCINCTLSVSAQTQAQHYVYYARAVDLFNKEMYRSAQEQLRLAAADLQRTDASTYAPLHAEIDFLNALCAVETKQNDAELLLNAVLTAQPSSLRYPEAVNAYGQWLYDETRYAESLDWYKKIVAEDLPMNLRNAYLFKSGYSALMSGDKAFATSNFRRLKDEKNQYAEASLYYYSHIEYEAGNLHTASAGFEKLRNSPNYASLVPYYTIQIAFAQKKYDRVIKEGESFLQYSTDNRRNEIARVVSEAYLFTGNATKAKTFFKEYEKASTEISREDKVLKGYILYADKDYKEAAKSFKEAATPEDSIAQISYYYQGDCYINDQNKKGAMDAFMRASKMDYDAGIQEKSMLNYAKLALELDQNDAIMEAYLDKYPHGRQNTELSIYRSASAAQKGQYPEAIDLLYTVQSPSPSEQLAIQRIAFGAGLSMMEAKKYGQAISYFDLSLNNSALNNSETALSRYWKAEALYAQDDYKAALPLYELFINTGSAYKQMREYKLAHYNVAYCCFKLQNFADAQRWFKKYVVFENSSTRKTPQLADSYNRIGDCYYKQRDFGQAIDNYVLAENLNLSLPDYSAFQRAMSLGFTKGNDDKIKGLQHVVKAYPKSKYVGASYFEVGRTYQQQSNYNDAEKSFLILINNHKTSPYYNQALVEMGLIELNRGNNDKALSYYQRVIEQSANSEEAKNALEGIKSIYIEQNRMDEYFAYANRIGQGVNSAPEKDSLLFVAAEKQYQSGNCEQAIPALKRYLSDLPKESKDANIHIAHFYMADCAMRRKEYDVAIVSYQYVCAQAKNDFTESSWAGLAEAYFNLKNYDRAGNAFEQYRNFASTPQNKLEAEVGCMRSYMALNRNDKAVSSASNIAASKGISPELMSEAKLVLGIQKKNTGKYKDAIEDLQPLVKDRSKPLDAQAQYNIIVCYFNLAKYKDLENEVFAFADAKRANQYWLAKSFIVLGDYYVKTKDREQAQATYKSIIEGYTNQTDGVIEEAQLKLDAMR